MQKWSEHKLFKQLADRALVFAGELAVRETQFHIVNWIDDQPIESPIEAGFSLWWMLMGSHEVRLFPQHPVVIAEKSYRLDFKAAPADPLVALLAESLHIPFRFAIELDGHEFHERTKEQVTVRNQRDRALQAAGWRVCHVSGSELVRDPEKVVNEVHVDAAIYFLNFCDDVSKALIGRPVRA
jgi:hypothetical protein